MSALLHGRYAPDAIVGIGGQGTVLRARDERHDRLVAIKVRHIPSPEARDTLLEEARVLLELDPHANLPLVRDDFFVDDRYCIVMDWIEGRSLAEIHAAEGDPGLPHPFVLDALEQVARALDHLHTHDPPVLHLDVKPSNIVVRDDGRAVLVDLGLAGTGVAAGYAGGTPAYTAPELGWGHPLTRAADVFSLAATAHELLSGEPPVPGGPFVADATAIRAGLSTDPTRRPATAGDFVRRLRPAASPTNLPASLSNFVGRQRAVADVTRALEATRCLSLVGFGGIGKTRLALEVARNQLPSFPQGVWLAELAGLSEETSITSHVAAALGIAEERGHPIRDALVTHLGSGRQLLVLDNCEHVIDASAHLVEDLLRSCADLTILTTSREPLRVQGETVWRVGPMDVPHDDFTPDVESVALFCERARSADARFQADRTTLGAVAAVCRTLEGIPLAIELAAALVGDRAIDEIASELDRALAALTHGNRTLPRQSSLRATINWSYESLSDDERDLFGRLSVFSGPFDAGAARAVAGPTASDALITLADKSLCERHDTPDGVWFRMLEPVRQFSAEQLAADLGAEQETRDRHLAWILDVVQAHTPALRRGETTHQIDLVADDVDAAIAWADQRAEALQLGVATAPYWRLRGRWTVARSALERCIDRAPPDDPLVGAALIELGTIARLQGDLDDAASAFDRALARVSEDEGRVWDALRGRAKVASDRGDHQAARDGLMNLIGTIRVMDDPERTIDGLSDLATEEQYVGDLSAARRSIAEAVSLADERSDHRARAQLLCQLGAIDYNRGERQAAKESLHTALTIAREMDDAVICGTALEHLGTCASGDGNQEAACGLFEESLEIFRRLGLRQRVALTLAELAIPVIQQRDFARGHDLLQESLALSLATGLDLMAGECLHKLSMLARAENDIAASFDHLRRALVICAEHDDSLRLALLLEHAAGLAIETGAHEEGLILSAAAWSHREAVAFPRPAMAVLERDLARATEAVGPRVASRADATGKAMPLDEAIARAGELCANRGLPPGRVKRDGAADPGTPPGAERIVR